MNRNTSAGGTGGIQWLSQGNRVNWHWTSDWGIKGHIHVVSSPGACGSVEPTACCKCLPEQGRRHELQLLLPDQTSQQLQAGVCGPRGRGAVNQAGLGRAQEATCGRGLRAPSCGLVVPSVCPDAPSVPPSLPGAQRSAAQRSTAARVARHPGPPAARRSTPATAASRRAASRQSAACPARGCGRWPTACQKSRCRGMPRRKPARRTWQGREGEATR